MSKPGDKVIALLDATEGVVRSFGEGTYAGDFPVAPEAGCMNFGQKNPRIDLDDGKTVWGCECWWGEADAVRKRFPHDWVWEHVDIDAHRAKSKAGQESQEKQ